MLTRVLNWNKNARLRKTMILDALSKPDVTVVIPVFNQDEIIYKHLQSLCESMTLSFELTLINDSSNDATDSEILRFLKNYDWGNSSCVRINYFENRWPWFETKCDDFAIREANSSYILEIQADMMIREVGFDKKLLNLLISTPKIFALSARGVHNLIDLRDEVRQSCQTNKIIHIKVLKIVKFKFKYLIGKFQNSNFETQINIKPMTPQAEDYSQKLSEIFPEDSRFSVTGRAGFLGTFVESLPYSGTSEVLEEVRLKSGSIWFGETIMRGPLIIDRQKYIEVGGLNVKQFFLGNDDHDLNLRIAQFGYKVGFTPIAFASPLELGNSRRKSKLSSRVWRKIHQIARQKGIRESALYNFLLNRHQTCGN